MHSRPALKISQGRKWLSSGGRAREARLTKGELEECGGQPWLITAPGEGLLLTTCRLALPTDPPCLLGSRDTPGETTAASRKTHCSQSERASPASMAYQLLPQFMTAVQSEGPPRNAAPVDRSLALGLSQRGIPAPLLPV